MAISRNQDLLSWPIYTARDIDPEEQTFLLFPGGNIKRAKALTRES